MTPVRCPWCTLLFPVDVRSDLRIGRYCANVAHWEHGGVDLHACTLNITYLINTFAAITPKERAEDALFRRMLWWLEARPW